MSQEMNMNEKKTPFKQFNADESHKDDQFGGEKFDAEKQQFKEPTYGTFDAKPVTTTTTTTTTTPAPEPGVFEKVKGVFSSHKDGKDSEFTDQSKPGVLEGAKQMVWHGVEKAKGVFSSSKFPTEPHPGNGYNWKKVTGEQGQTHWVATDDWSGDSARGTFWEKAKGVFSSNKAPDAKECEFTDKDQKECIEDQEQKGVFQGAKEKVWQGVEKAKGLFYSTTTIEQHPGKGFTWKKVKGEQGRFRWVATDDWSTTPSDKPGVFQGAKEKVWQGVEKAKEVFSTKSTDTYEQHPGKGHKWKKVEGQKGEEAHWKPKTGFQSLTGTH